MTRSGYNFTKGTWQIPLIAMTFSFLFGIINWVDVIMKLPLDKSEYRYECKDISNYDGDSFRLTIIKRWDFGFDIHVRQEYKIATRIYGIDTPELRDKRSAFKALGILARDRAREWVEAEPVIFLSLDKPDKYGRALGDFQRADGAKLTNYLLDNALAVPLSRSKQGRGSRCSPKEH